MTSSRDIDESPAVRIERAATELFGERGLEGTSVRELAARADATIGSINYYFGSKEGLFRHCTERLVSEFEEDLAAERITGVWFPGQEEDERTLRLRRLIRAWVDLQTARDDDLRDFGSNQLLRRVWAALQAANERSEGARQSLVAYVGSMLIGAILTDEQLEHLAEVPAHQARARWQELTRRLRTQTDPEDAVAAAMAAAAPKPR